MIRREGPWWLAVIISCGWVHVKAAPLKGSFPVGSDWHQYLYAARALADPTLAEAFPDWRSPVYPRVLGWLLASMDSVAASHLLATACIFGTIAAVGWAGRSLGGPAVGAVAAIIAGSLPMMVEGSLWMNAYPMEALWMSLAMAAGLSGWAGLASIAAGLAAATDPRGWLAVLLLPILLPLRRWPWLILALVLAEVLPLGAPRVMLSLAQQVEIQHQFSVQELIARGGSCTEPCRAALIRGGLASLDPNLPLAAGLGTLLWAAISLKTLFFRGVDTTFPEHFWKVLPELRKWLTISVLPVVVTVVGASTVLYRDRYLLPMVLPLSVAFPMALERLLLMFSFSQRFRCVLIALLGAISMAFFQPTPRPTEGLSHHGAAAWRWLQSHPEAAWMDCAGLGLETLALPRAPHAGRLNVAGIAVDSCSSWMTMPDSDRPAFLVTSKQFQINRLQPQYEGWVEQAIFDKPTIPLEPTITIWKRRHPHGAP